MLILGNNFRELSMFLAVFMYFTILMNSHNTPWGNAIILILQMRKLSHEMVKQLVQEQ